MINNSSITKLFVVLQCNFLDLPIHLVSPILIFMVSPILFFMLSRKCMVLIFFHFLSVTSSDDNFFYRNFPRANLGPVMGPYFFPNRDRNSQML